MRGLARNGLVVLAGASPAAWSSPPSATSVRSIQFSADLSCQGAEVLVEARPGRRSFAKDRCAELRR